MSQSRVELLDVHKSFGGIVALQDVTLRADAGEIHAIVGENGAGKSTLMKILSGAYKMDSGEIRLNGERITISDPKVGRERGYWDYLPGVFSYSGSVSGREYIPAFPEAEEKMDALV